MYVRVRVYVCVCVLFIEWLNKYAILYIRVSVCVYIYIYNISFCISHQYIWITTVNNGWFTGPREIRTRFFFFSFLFFTYITIRYAIYPLNYILRQTHFTSSHTYKASPLFALLLFFLFFLPSNLTSSSLVLSYTFSRSRPFSLSLFLSSSHSHSLRYLYAHARIQ